MHIIEQRLVSLGIYHDYIITKYRPYASKFFILRLYQLISRIGAPADAYASAAGRHHVAEHHKRRFPKAEF